MDRLTHDCQEIKRLVDSIPRHSIRGKRDRFLIVLASNCGLKISEIVSLQFWQLSYVYLSPLKWIGCPPTFLWPFPDGRQLGLFKDLKLDDVYCLARPGRNFLNHYRDLLACFSQAGMPLFPVIRRGDHVEVLTSISKKDAHKILKRVNQLADRENPITWNDIRRVGCAKLIRSGYGPEQIKRLTSYKSATSIRCIAKQFDLELNTATENEIRSVVRIRTKRTIRKTLL